MTQDFNSFGLPAKLLQALARMEFTTPTPIQAQAIPLAMAGRDVLGSAQTGTGKTGAFGIPLIAKLMEDETAGGLILTPTRELAAQVMATLQQMISIANLPTALLIGGEPMPRQFRQLEKRPRLIIGTPGRINDHLERGTLKMNHVRFLILDETDRMLDMGFGVQLARIFKFLPDTRQTMMFSATLPSDIVKLSSKYLNNPERIAVGSSNTPVDRIKQELIQVKDAEKYDRLVEQLEQREGSIIIFVKTKFGTERLARKLEAAGHRADAIHGDLQQRRRDRVIQTFRDKKFRILVATDVAARGLDIPHIEHVINYDLPQVAEDYIHRIGRTGRAGATGSAVNFLTTADGAKWRAIHKLIHGTNPTDGVGGDKDFAPRKSGGKKSWGDKKPWGEKKAWGDKGGEKRSFGGPKKSWGDRDGGKGSDRDFDRKPREFREERPAARGGDFREERPKRDFGDAPRPRRDFGSSDRPKRDFGDAPRPRRDFGDSPRPARSEGGFKKPFKKSFGDSPRPSFRSDDRPKRDFGDAPRPRRDFGDAPRPRRDADDRPRRDFGDAPRPRRDFGDAPRSRGDDRGASGEKKQFGHKSPNSKFHWSNKQARPAGPSAGYAKKPGGFAAKRPRREAAE